MRAGFGSRVGVNQSSGVRVTYRQHLEVDLELFARVAGGRIAAMIRSRTLGGTDAKGRPLPTDLRDTGEMLRSLRARKAKVDKRRSRAEVSVGGNTAKRGKRRKITNAALAAILHHGRKVSRKRSLTSGVSSRRERRTLTNIAHRAGNTYVIPGIPFMGLTDKQRQRLMDLIARDGLIKTKPGPPPEGGKAITIKRS